MPIPYCTGSNASIILPVRKHVDFELVHTRDVYAIGDGAGFTRSLSQAAAHGLYVADHYLEKIKEHTHD